jgi:hypothetical protein
LLAKEFLTSLSIILIPLNLLGMILFIPALNRLFYVHALPVREGWIFLLATFVFTLWLEPLKGRAKWVSGG